MNLPFQLFLQFKSKIYDALGKKLIHAHYLFGGVSFLVSYFFLQLFASKIARQNFFSLSTPNCFLSFHYSAISCCIGTMLI